MGASVLVDAGFIIALLDRRDHHHAWALPEARSMPRPWLTCEAALSEGFHLLGPVGAPPLIELLRGGSVRLEFDLGSQFEPVTRLMEKYRDVPMSLADACLVRMTEILPDCVLLTADADFRVYRRHSRQVIPAHYPE